MKLQELRELRREIESWLKNHTLETENDFVYLQEAFPIIWVENAGQSGLQPDKKLYILYFDSHCDGQWHDDFEEIMEVRV